MICMMTTVPFKMAYLEDKIMADGLKQFEADEPY